MALTVMNCNAVADVPTRYVFYEPRSFEFVCLSIGLVPSIRRSAGEVHSCRFPTLEDLR